MSQQIVLGQEYLRPNVGQGGSCNTGLVLLDN